jgi:predicted hotdog family 3-hydroxylacyl-ACP dehydratase
MRADTAIKKAEIRTLIPHSGLMCLLDEVTEWDQRSIVCITNTHRDPVNPLRREGCLAAVHAFEYGAQAAAVHGGLRARLAGSTVYECSISAATVVIAEGRVIIVERT